ncbi:trypsin-like peptidase domain-containing protein [Actinocorallia sp. API 0066]|nr:trypsin-like peptidase domain-containing protein [Actinocorallia sp. API 0066]
MNTALGRGRRAVESPVGQWVQVEFPFAGPEGQRVTRAAEVVVWTPKEGAPFEPRDVAGLRLEEDLPDGVEPATLASTGETPDGERRVGAWGPNADGRASRPGNIAGTLMGSYDAARLQVDGDLRGVFRVGPGYSGGPVWAQDTGQVVGIVQAIPKADEAVDVYVIGADALVAAWSDVLYRPPPNPYRALAAFTEADAPYFFGRERFVAELAGAVDDEPLILVGGSSGVGKSSVVAAGLVPALRARAPLAVAAFRPGDDPMTRLAGALAKAAGSRGPDPLNELTGWRGLLHEGGLPQAASYVCTATDTARLLVIIDQFEQLFTECAPDQRAELIALLNGLLRSPSGAVRVAASFRSDFFHLFADAEDPLGAYTKHWHHLRAMTPEEITRAITEPALLADGRRPIHFDDGLADLIREEFQGHPGELPLLEFTLTRLWELQRGQTLTLTAYNSLGRVTGALSDYAEAQYHALSSAQQAAAHRIFTRLVQPDRPDVARHVRREDLRAADWPTVERLRDLRLLSVTVQNDAHTESPIHSPQEPVLVVELAHEALLRGWPRLQGWLTKGKDFRAWQVITVAARQQWLAHARDPDLLLRGPLLTRALTMLETHPEDLESLTEFITLSRTHAETEKAERDRYTRQSQALRLAHQSRYALTSGPHGVRHSLALGILSLQSFPTFDGDQALRQALRRSARPLTPPLAHDGSVRSVVFSGDGLRVATASFDGTARVWGVASGKQVARLDHEGLVRSVVFSGDGSRVATASFDRTARVWKVEREELVREALGRLVVNLSPEEWWRYGVSGPYRKLREDLA